MPSLDQSVARHVSLVLSKIFTSLVISVVATVLDSSNNWSRLSSQWNVMIGLIKSLNGSIHLAMLARHFVLGCDNLKIAVDHKPLQNILETDLWIKSITPESDILNGAYTRSYKNPLMSF